MEGLEIMAVAVEFSVLFSVLQALRGSKSMDLTAYEWMFFQIERQVGEKLCWIYRTSLQVVQRLMDDMVLKFAKRLAFTIEEQRVVVINDKESALFRATKVFLSWRVLTRKTFNKDRFKQQMLNFWRPWLGLQLWNWMMACFHLVSIPNVKGRWCRMGFHSCMIVPCWCWRRWITWRT